ncbi:uncharacterized protein AMSG_03962 [Thecamonas trahens ATCC 50062]|uniref:Transmembrane protein 198 n=1 Tax=Thecamonas trahens ATCC 50062 TaxID=461836 RepID=A0A0L0D6B0_THETB|nr:hypothetical protein AMSG_03962 [Thecamonas trahens ATCC 50062]KNC47735.1 hypothetical protein AMSG_03962 [Thecamonas trahens ATCC 50062]|eukprot:XP_013759213.1 hypothetical protein AMSG_03962 [Thecamonas trahens ATCC 50062]
MNRGECFPATNATVLECAADQWRAPGSTACLPALCSLSLLDTVGYAAVALAGILAIALGYRLFRLAFTLLALALGGLTWLALIQYAPHLSLAARIASSSIAALLALLILHSALRAGIFAVGACAGIVLMGVVLSIPAAGSQLVAHTSPLVRLVIVAAVAFATGVVALMAERMVLILATSWVGSFAFFVAFDVFLAAAGIGCGSHLALSRWQSGYFRAAVGRVLVSLQIYAYSPPPQPAATLSFFALLAAFVVTTACGVAVQTTWTIGSFHHRHRHSSSPQPLVLSVTSPLLQQP